MSYFLSRRIASAEQNLDGVQNSITALSTSTTTLSGNVLTLEQDLILTEDSLLASLGLQSTQLTAKINAVNANVSSLQSNVSGTNASINSNITVLQGNVSTLTSNIGTLQTTIASINGNVSSATSNINLLQSNVSSIKSNITALQSSVAGISSIQDSQALMLINQGLYIGVLEQNQSYISGNVSILQGNIASINANYTVKSLTAGTNITTANSNGNWTISASGSGGATQLNAYYATTAMIVANQLTTITLPTPINLNDYDIRLLFNATFLSDGSTGTYTFFNIRYNNFYSGKMVWSNTIHNGYDFSPIPDNGYNNPTSGQGGGTYNQCYTNPYFAYMPSYNYLSRLQHINSEMIISKTPYNFTQQYAVITTKFRTSVGQTNGIIDTDVDTGRFQSQEGHIQSSGFASGQNFPLISTITIGQAGGTGRNSWQQNGVGTSPAEIVIWIMRKS